MRAEKQSSLAVGVDGGQSSTLAVVGALDGTILGYGLGGGMSHPAATGTGSGDANMLALRHAIGAAFRMANLDQNSPVESMWVTTTAAIDQLGSFAHELYRPSRLHVGPDAEITLASAGLREGVGLAVGTGVVCELVSERGRTVLGGWGWLLGDEGSAYWIGAQALRLAVRSYDGRGPRTSLERVVLDRFGARDPRELFELAHVGALDRPSIAALARIVADHAEFDPGAQALVDNAAEELTLLVSTALRSDPLVPRALATTGGVLGPDGRVFAALKKRLHELEPALEVHPSLLPPAATAYLLAVSESPAASAYDVAKFNLSRLGLLNEKDGTT